MIRNQYRDYTITYFKPIGNIESFFDLYHPKKLKHINQKII